MLFGLGIEEKFRKANRQEGIPGIFKGMAGSAITIAGVRNLCNLAKKDLDYSKEVEIGKKKSRHLADFMPSQAEA